MPELVPVKGSSHQFRAIIDQLIGGWNTRAFPTDIPDEYLYVLDNCVYTQDGLVSKRPGNEFSSNGTNAPGQSTGSGAPILSGTRFYQTTGPLTVVTSGLNTWAAADGAPFGIIGTGSTGRVTFRYAQMYDPDAVLVSGGPGSIVLIMVDKNGIVGPQYWPGTVSGVNPLNPFRTTNFPTGTGLSALPNDPVTLQPILPKFVCVWGPNLVFANTQADPGALYISDSLRPQRFNGFSMQDTGGTNYYPY